MAKKKSKKEQMKELQEAKYQLILSGKSKEELIEHCMRNHRIMEAAIDLSIELIKDRAKILAETGDTELFNKLKMNQII